MARTLSEKQHIGDLDGFPIYLTWKTVKNVNLRIKHDGIYVSANPSVSIDEIINLINKNKLKYIKAISEFGWTDSIPMFVQVKDIQFDSVLLFGKRYRIVFDGRVETMHPHKHFFLVPRDYLNASFEKFLNDLDAYMQAQLEEYILTRLSFWCSITGINYRSFKIRKMTSRWGSCSVNSGKMRFNFYLAALPKNAIDSVVIHELIHMKVPNHQKGFYDMIIRYDPNYFRDHEIIKSTRLPIKYIEADLNAKNR